MDLAEILSGPKDVTSCNERMQDFLKKECLLMSKPVTEPDSEITRSQTRPCFFPFSLKTGKPFNKASVRKVHPAFPNTNSMVFFSPFNS